jgi:hypothetical protein
MLTGEGMPGLHGGTEADATRRVTEKTLDLNGGLSIMSANSRGWAEKSAARKPMGIETVEYNGTKYAEIIWADTRVDHTVFFSPPESSFQFGLLAHEAGFVEPAHYHKPVRREINDLQQMFVVQRGVVEVLLYGDDGTLLREIVMNPGDAIVLIHGAHAISVKEDMQCISVKQGPFLGTENDKIMVKVKA